jgi:hypothetical protein
MKVEQMRIIASAIKAGRDAAKAGRTDNPFQKGNELLRRAWHFGWNLDRELGEKLIPEDRLVALYGPGMDCQVLADLIK